MKSLTLVLLLLLAGCLCLSECNFFEGQKVLVAHGFFRGHSGVVVDIMESSGGTYSYKVEIRKKGNKFCSYEWIRESDLTSFPEAEEDVK